MLSGLAPRDLPAPTAPAFRAGSQEPRPLPYIPTAQHGTHRDSPARGAAAGPASRGAAGGLRIPRLPALRQWRSSEGGCALRQWRRLVVPVPGPGAPSAFGRRARRRPLPATLDLAPALRRADRPSRRAFAPPPVDSPLWQRVAGSGIDYKAISLAGAAEGWAVGSDHGLSHWDGADWTDYPAQYLADVSSQTFNAVSTLDGTHAWAVGSGGMTYCLGRRELGARHADQHGRPHRCHHGRARRGVGRGQHRRDLALDGRRPQLDALPAPAITGGVTGLAMLSGAEGWRWARATPSITLTESPSRFPPQTFHVGVQSSARSRRSPPAISGSPGPAAPSGTPQRRLRCHVRHTPSGHHVHLNAIGMLPSGEGGRWGPRPTGLPPSPRRRRVSTDSVNVGRSSLGRRRHALQHGRLGRRRAVHGVSPGERPHVRRTAKYHLDGRPWPPTGQPHLSGSTP